MKNKNLRYLIATASSLTAVCALAIVIGWSGSPAPSPEVTSDAAAPAAETSASVPVDDDADVDASTPDDPAAFEPGCALAMLEDGAEPESAIAAVTSIPELAGVTATSAEENMVKFALPEGMTVIRAAELMEGAEGVAAAQPNYRYYLQGDGQSLQAASLTTGSSSLTTQAVADDPGRSLQWGLDSMKVPAAWNTVTKLGKSTKAVGVAVLDSGFRTTHEDLKGVIAKTYNAVTGGSNVGVGDKENLEHGTHVAGIVAAQSNNGLGVSGVAYNTSDFTTCKLIPIQVADSEGGITTDTLVRAYGWMKRYRTTYNIRVANMSLGGDRGERLGRGDVLLGYAINRLWNDGVVTVAAGGNIDDWYTTTPFDTWPSDSPNVVSVINLARSKNTDGAGRSSVSNFNTAGQRAKDISAPGTGILSAGFTSDTSYKYLTGTSMASPAVAGVLALEFKANPKLTPAEATSKLYSTARDLTKCAGAKVGWDRVTGYGEVNAAAVVSAKSPYLSGATMMTAGKKARLTVKINNVKQSASAWKWSSSNTAIATVSATGVVTSKKAGEVTIMAKRGSKVAQQTLTITGKKTNVANLSISIPAQEYTGSALKPDPVVRDGGVRLTKGKHYTVTWKNNKNVGLAVATIKGISPYTGTTTKTFVIRSKATSN